MSFKDIQDKIQKNLKEKDHVETPGQPEHIGEVADKKIIQPVTEKGMPDPSQSGIIGRVLSEPGTENVVLEASTFHLMKCIAHIRGRDKTRYCIVELNKKATYGSHWINSQGFRTHIVTREVFQLLHGVFLSVQKTIRTLSDDRDRYKEKYETNNMTIEALKKNGII